MKRRCVWGLAGILFAGSIFSAARAAEAIDPLVKVNKDEGYDWHIDNGEPYNVKVTFHWVSFNGSGDQTALMAAKSRIDAGVQVDGGTVTLLSTVRS